MINSIILALLFSLQLHALPSNCDAYLTPAEVNELESLISEITEVIDSARTEHPSKRLVAAFDFDGTITQMDSSLNLLTQAFLSGRFPNLDQLVMESGLWSPFEPKTSELFVEYFHGMFLKDGGGEEVYDEAVRSISRTFTGFHPDEVHEVVEEIILAEEGLSVFLFSIMLIDWLHEQEVDVYILTASKKFSVHPYAKHLDIPHHRVIGVELEQDHRGRFTEEVIEPMSSGAGKPIRLKQVIGEDAHVILTAGNTSADGPFIEEHETTAVSLVIHGDPDMPSEVKLREKAEKSGWRVVKPSSTHTLKNSF